MYFAVFLILLVLLAFVLMLLLAVYPVKFAGEFNSERQPDIDALVSWLNPLLTGSISKHDEKIVLTVKLFRKKIFVKDLAVKGQITIREVLDNYIDYIKMLRALRINNGRIYASYGFDNPALTGVICGAVNLVLQYVDIEKFYNYPDFVADSSYFNISAKAEINGAVSLLNIMRGNRIHLTRHHHALGKAR